MLSEKLQWMQWETEHFKNQRAPIHGGVSQTDSGLGQPCCATLFRMCVPTGKALGISFQIRKQTSKANSPSDCHIM